LRNSNRNSPRDLAGGLGEDCEAKKGKGAATDGNDSPKKKTGRPAHTATVGESILIGTRARQRKRRMRTLLAKTPFHDELYAKNPRDDLARERPGSRFARRAMG
jgi:hypothetical protein